MYNITNIKSNKIYKNVQVRFISSTSNRNKNSVIFSLTNSVDETIKFINDKNLNLNVYKCFYSPFKERFKMGMVEKRYDFSQVLTYENVKQSCPQVRVFRRKPDQYKQMNLIYDLSLVNSTFLNSVQLPPKRKAENYFNLIKDIVTNLSGYEEKTLYIPYTFNGIKSIKDFRNPLKIENFIQALGYISFLYPERLKELDGVDIFLHEPNSNVFIRFQAKDLIDNMSYITRSIIILNKLADRQTLTVEENALLNTSLQTTSNGREEIKSAKEDLATKLSDDLIKRLSVNTRSFTGEDAEISDNAKEVIQKVLEEKELSNKKEIAKELETNEELVKIAEEFAREKIINKKSSAMSKRDELLKQEHDALKVDGKKTLSEVLNEFNDKKLEKKVIKNENLVFDSLKQSTIKDFEVEYNKKQYKKDELMVLDAFSKDDKEINMFIRNIEREDTSDSFTKKETLTVHFEDTNRVRHTFKVDIPKIIDDKYLMINGNKKQFVKQLILKPVVKTAPDAVQLVTNYNKIFLTRKGQKSSPKIERIKKYLSILENKNYSIKKADSTLVNAVYLTNLEYDEYAKDIFSLIIKDTLLCFNQKDVRKNLADINFDVEKLKVNQLPIGIKNKKPIILDVEMNVVEGSNGLSLTDFIVNELKEIDKDIETELTKISVGKKYVYTEASVLSRTIPLILFLSYKDGLSSILRKAKVNHTFTDKRPSLSPEEKNNKGVVQFADGYLVYDLYPFSNSLLLNALSEIPTKEYEFNLFDTKELYLEFFNNMYGTRTVGKGLDNIYQLFLDPITKEIIKDLGLPEDFSELFLYANKLLEDNVYKKENDMSLYRIRSVELINAYLYRVLADAYKVYKDSKNASTPIKVSVPQDKLLKELLLSLNTEDVNILNPAISATNNCTYKGLAGLKKK